MPRMSREELEDIVNKGFRKVGLTAGAGLAQNIARMSQGLPHFTHLLALHSANNTVANGRKRVQGDDLHAALSIAIDDAQESVKHAYRAATASARRQNLYKHVLLACAMAPVDDLGYFQPVDVREPMSDIMKKKYDIPAFIRHLNELSDEKRGKALQKIGTPRKERFRFSNPLLKSHVFLRGIHDRMVPSDALEPFDN
jgi:hypothetical protein